MSDMRDPVWKTAQYADEIKRRLRQHDAAAPGLVQGQMRDGQDAAHHPGLWSSPMISTKRSSSVRRRPCIA